MPFGETTLDTAGLRRQPLPAIFRDDHADFPSAPAIPIAGDTVHSSARSHTARGGDAVSFTIEDRKVRSENRPKVSVCPKETADDVNAAMVGIYGRGAKAAAAAGD